MNITDAHTLGNRIHEGKKYDESTEKVFRRKQKNPAVRMLEKQL